MGSRTGNILALLLGHAEVVPEQKPQGLVAGYKRTISTQKNNRPHVNCSFRTKPSTIGGCTVKNWLLNYEAYISLFLEYQILTNTDRHLNNFGVLRDTHTLKSIGMAPIFDSGNSIFWQNPDCDELRKIYEMDLLIPCVDSILLGYQKKRELTAI